MRCTPGTQPARPRPKGPAMPNTIDPDNLRVTDDLYAAGRAAAGGASVLENPWPGTGHIGRAWFAGWLDGGERAVRAYPHLLADDRAELF